MPLLQSLYDLGVPVGATAVGRVPDLVSDEVGRVVAPGDMARRHLRFPRRPRLPSFRHALEVRAGGGPVTSRTRSILRSARAWRRGWNATHVGSAPYYRAFRRALLVRCCAAAVAS